MMIKNESVEQTRPCVCGGGGGGGVGMLYVGRTAKDRTSRKDAF